MTGHTPLRAILLLLLLAGCNQGPDTSAPGTQPASFAPNTGRVRVYDGRERRNLRPLLDIYEMQARTVVELVAEDDPTGRAGADLVILGGLADLWDAGEANRFRPAFAADLATRVPPGLRDEDSRWLPLSVRARLVFYDPEVVTADQAATVKRYADLGDEQWRGRLCLSSSALSGNRLLIAFLIREVGIRDTELIVRRWQANLAAPPFDSDASLVEATRNGDCAIGVADSAELERLASEHPARTLATVSFGSPNALAVDISGAGVARHAGNPEAAVALLKWLSDSSFNSMFAAHTFEYTVDLEAAPGNQAMIEQIRQSAAPPYSLTELGFQLDEARLLVERAHYP